jgi:hypothetical protein
LIAINITPSGESGDVAHAIRLRILALIARHPEILEMAEPKLISSILLDYPEFEFLDLNPNFAEMCWAFRSAVKISKAQQGKP